MAFPQCVDISEFQPSTVEYFQELSNHSAKGAFIRINYGYGFPDRTAATKIRLSNKYLDFTGCYAFFLGNPISEAKYFLDYIEYYGMDHSTPVMLDVEPNQSYNGPQTYLINQWTDIVYNAGYHNIFIYASTSWLTDGYHIKPENLKHGRIWAAAYNDYAPGVNNASMWQYTDNWRYLHTDGNMIFIPLNKLTGEDDSSILRKRINKSVNHYLTKGNYFKAVSNIKGYSDYNLTKQNGNDLSKGSLFRGKIVSHGAIKRIYNGLGYFSVNEKYVKAI